MKKIINYTLLLLTIISTTVALKYSSLPIPEFLPPKIACFWITSSEEQQQYILLYDLSVGFILSALFYFIVEVIPERIRIFKAKKLIENYTNQLVEKMEQIVSVVITKYSRNPHLNQLAQKDFLILNGETATAQQEVSYVTTPYLVKSGKKCTGVHSYSTIDKLIKDNLKHIVGQLQTIKNYEFFYAGDDRFVETIRKIENCKLIRCYLPKSDNSAPCFLYFDSSNAMIEFVQLYLELLKCKFHTKYCITTLDSEEETQQYHADRQNGTFLKQASEINRERLNRAIVNPTIFISGTKYTTDILISELKRNIAASYISLRDVENTDLSNFKYAVFIVDSEAREFIINLLNNNKLTPQIILITEQNIIKRNTTSQIKNASNQIVVELFFKSAFYIKHIPGLFIKEEPSRETIGTIYKELEATLYSKENDVSIKHE